MKHITKNSEAVSPVIGVILMVAITVILAAVIAAFVFGMAGNIQATKTVAVTGERISSTQVQFINHGGKDVAALSKIEVTGDITGGPTIVGNVVGATNKSTVSATPAHVIVTGTFNDGTQQILLESNL